MGLSKWAMYKNGNYLVKLNLADGTKIRETDDDEFKAAFPESMDVKITNKCSLGCPWCHENSVPNGAHGDLKIPAMSTFRPFQEIAIGGGNVLEHPELLDFLLRLKEMHCVPSITISQHHFLENLEYVKSLYTQGLVYGIGVSLSSPTGELISAMKELPTSVLHAIVGVFDKDDFNKLKGNGLKILLLGYKDIRRGSLFLSANRNDVRKKIDWLGENLREVMDGFPICSFDNLALEQLPVREVAGELAWEQCYMGDDGRHTFYIDLVEGEFAMSSTSLDRHPIGELSIDGMFKVVLKEKDEKDAGKSASLHAAPKD